MELIDDKGEDGKEVGMIITWQRCNFIFFNLL